MAGMGSVLSGSWRFCPALNSNKAQTKKAAPSAAFFAQISFLKAFCFKLPFAQQGAVRSR
jgi:hypothetical protein